MNSAQKLRKLTFLMGVVAMNCVRTGFGSVEDCKRASTVLGRAGELRTQAQQSFQMRREFQSKYFQEGQVLRSSVVSRMLLEAWGNLEDASRTQVSGDLLKTHEDGARMHLYVGDSPSVATLVLVDLKKFSSYVPHVFNLFTPIANSGYRANIIPGPEIRTIRLLGLFDTAFPKELFVNQADSELALQNLRRMEIHAERLGISLNEYRQIGEKVRAMFDDVESSQDARHAFFNNLSLSFDNLKALTEAESKVAQLEEEKSRLSVTPSWYDMGYRSRVNRNAKDLAEAVSVREKYKSALQIPPGVEKEQEKIIPSPKVLIPDPHSLAVAYEPKDRTSLLGNPSEAISDPVRDGALKALAERKDLKSRLFDEGNLFATKSGQALKSQKSPADIWLQLTSTFSDKFLHRPLSTAQAALVAAQLKTKLSQLEISEEEFSRFVQEIKEIEQDPKLKDMVIELIRDWKNDFEKLKKIEAHLVGDKKDIRVTPKIEAVSIREIVQEIDSGTVAIPTDDHPIAPYVSAVSDWTKAVVVHGNIKKVDLFSAVSNEVSDLKKSKSRVSHDELAQRLSPLLSQAVEQLDRKSANFKNLVREGMIIQTGLARHLERALQSASSIEEKIASRAEISDLQEEILLHEYDRATAAINSATTLKTGLDALLSATRANELNVDFVKKESLEELQFLQLLAISPEASLTKEQVTRLNEILAKYGYSP